MKSHPNLIKRHLLIPDLTTCYSGPAHCSSGSHFPSFPLYHPSKLTLKTASLRILDLWLLVGFCQQEAQTRRMRIGQGDTVCIPLSDPYLAAFCPGPCILRPQFLLGNSLLRHFCLCLCVCPKASPPHLISFFSFAYYLSLGPFLNSFNFKASFKDLIGAFRVSSGRCVKPIT